MFETGNLYSATETAPNHFTLSIACDLQDTELANAQHTGYFHFRITRKFITSPLTIKITIANFAKNQRRNLLHGWAPVFYDSYASLDWAYIPKKVTNIQNKDNTLQFSFKYAFSDSAIHSVHFASCIPYSFTRTQQVIARLESQFTSDNQIYFKKDILTHSLDHRPIHLLTIAHNASVPTDISVLYPELLELEEKDLAASSNRKVVLISARIHPAESPASHILEGLLDALINTQTSLLAEAIVLIIPMLNPDGVVNGYYRSDSKGRDLNRVYDDETSQDLPANIALKLLIKKYTNLNRLAMFIDLHTHSLYDGLFIYGNSGEAAADHNEVRLLMQGLELHCPHFMQNNSEYSEPNEEPEKPGVGRFYLKKITNLKHIYTIESSYFRGKPSESTSTATRLIREEFHAIGRCILPAIDSTWAEIKNRDPYFQYVDDYDYYDEL